MTEIEVPDGFFAALIGTAADGGIALQPSKRCDIELRPVVGSDVSAGLSGQRGLDGIAGLPACRDTGHAAESDEQQRLYAAVSLQIDGTVGRNVVEIAVLAHEGVADVFRDVIVDPACADEGVLVVPGDLRLQHP